MGFGDHPLCVLQCLQVEGRAASLSFVSVCDIFEFGCKITPGEDRQNEEMQEHLLNGR
jgi:hypothetical protein